jgi:hypothetical protein
MHLSHSCTEHKKNHDIRNPGHSLGQARKCDGVISFISTFFNDNLLSYFQMLNLLLNFDNITFSSKSVIFHVLQFKNYGLLVELSIVAGNDFTGHFMWNGLQKQLDIRGHPHVQNIAGWLWHYKSADNHPVLRNEMVRKLCQWP